MVYRKIDSYLTVRVLVNILYPYNFATHLLCFKYKL